MRQTVYQLKPQFDLFGALRYYNLYGPDYVRGGYQPLAFLQAVNSPEAAKLVIEGRQRVVNLDFDGEVIKESEEGTLTEVSENGK